MTPFALLPLIVGCFTAGVIITWPIAHARGRRTAPAAQARDQAEISRILTGIEVTDRDLVFDAAEPEPTKALAVRHAAPAPDIDWRRGEHRTFSWGWLVEVVVRLASVGAKPNLPLAPEEYTPRHSQTVGEVTQEFRRIMATEFGSHRCDSCTVGRDGEPQHVSCVGCSCPCSTVDQMPEGVAGYAIAGRTR